MRQTGCSGGSLRGGASSAGARRRRGRGGRRPAQHPVRGGARQPHAHGALPPRGVRRQRRRRRQRGEFSE